MTKPTSPLSAITERPTRRLRRDADASAERAHDGITVHGIPVRGIVGCANAPRPRPACLARPASSASGTLNVAGSDRDGRRGRIVGTTPALRRRGGRSLAVLAVATHLLAACSVTRTPPGTAAAAGGLPERFLHPGDGPEAPARSSGDFWAAFGGRELAALVRRAEAGSLDLAVATTRIEQAAALREQAAALLLPTGNGQATRSRQRLPAGAASPTATRPYPTVTLSALGLSAAYEFDFWGKNQAVLAGAENTLAASRSDAETVRLTVTATAASLYLEAVSLKDQITVARNNVRLARRVADSLRQRVEAGSATEIDRAQQETLVLRQEATIPQLERALGETELRLAVLLGEPPGHVRITTASLDALSLPLPRLGLPSDLLRRRPDVVAAEQRVLAAAENVTAAKAAMLPSFSLGTLVGQQSLRAATLLSPQALAFQVVGGVAVPLFDQVRLAAQLRGQEGVQDELVATYWRAILSALGDVEAARVDLRTTQRQEAILRAALAQAQRAYSLGSEQLAAGELDLLTVLQTQTAYFQTLSALKQVQLTRFQAGVALFRALGGGWSEAETRLATREGPPSGQDRSLLASPRAKLSPATDG